MGIIGFQKLQAEEVDGGSVKLQMLDTIREWKTAHPEQQPIVVIRLKELLISVVQLSVKAGFYGGSHRYYHEQLNTFFQHFRALNVKLVFFGGGTKTKDKLAKITMRSDQDYKKYNMLLEHIDKTKEVKVCARPEFRTCLGLYEEGIARMYGEYILSTGSLNKDIVQYTRANENVISILAKDSDFLLYDLRSVQYWSCGIEDLNFRDMTTVAFSHAAMLSHLNLTPYQFHVMLAIAGVILDDAKNHCYQVKKGIFDVKRPGNSQIIRSISDCVRKNVPEVEEKPNFGAWTTMTFTKASEQYCWLIEKTFRKYEIGENESQVPETVPDDVSVWRKYKNIWSIANDELVRLDFNFMDVSRWNGDRNAMSYHNLYVLVFKRAMGIVLYSKRNDDEVPKRRFLMKGYEKERFKILSKTLAYPPFDVPPIEKLIATGDDTKTDGEFIDMKWSILFWILHLGITDEAKLKIRNLPREMVPVVITVLFLVWEHQITPLEGDAITISENIISNQPAGNDVVNYPAKTDGRNIRIAHIYVQTRILMNRCFQICGIDLFNVPVSFDGVQFHNVIDRFDEDAEAFDKLKEDIKDLVIDAF